MKFIVMDTKTGYTRDYSKDEILNIFDCETRYEHFQSQEEYDLVINNPAEFFEEETLQEDLEEYKKKWENNVYTNEKDFLTAIIEYRTWTSPVGVIPEHRILKIIESKMDLYK